MNRKRKAAFLWAPRGADSNARSPYTHPTSILKGVMKWIQFISVKCSFFVCVAHDTACLEKVALVFEIFKVFTRPMRPQFFAFSFSFLDPDNF
jgi:hypothetical protein